MKPPFAMSREKNLVNMWVVLLGKKQETGFGDANFDIPIVYLETPAMGYMCLEFSRDLG